MTIQKHLRVALTVALLTALLAPFGASVAHAQAVPVPDFCFFVDTGSGVTSISNDTAPMQELDDAAQPRNPRQSFKLGFGSSIDTTGVDGCAENEFVGPGFGEILRGQLSATLPIGTPPSTLWVVLDANDDGIGSYDDSTQTWTPGPDDRLFQPAEVRVDGTLLSEGGAASLPVGGSSGAVIPAIIVPEPSFAALVLLGTLGLSAAANAGTRRRG